MSSHPADHARWSPLLAPAMLRPVRFTRERIATAHRYGPHGQLFLSRGSPGDGRLEPSRAG
jgi:hypothetical protein